MISNLVSLIQKSFQPPALTKVEQKRVGENPFASNDKNSYSFGSAFGQNKNYGKNMPIPGGYFAGYYNEKPNIVGRKLYIEA
jgi:hypothetical protein